MVSPFASHALLLWWLNYLRNYTYATVSDLGSISDCSANADLIYTCKNQREEHSMALHDEIRKDINRNIVPIHFWADDLKTRPDPINAGNFLVGDLSYAEKSLVSIPQNLYISEDGQEQGHEVIMNGKQPRYIKLEPGLFEILWQFLYRNIRKDCHFA